MGEVALMAMELPTSPKVYTTTYDNFKGVDFTNDATNIWRRRSPTGTNMLPDASGRPFKRDGWNILLSNDDICLALNLNGYAEATVTEDEFNANKSGYYTESGGVYTQCQDEDTYNPLTTYYVATMPDKRPVIQKCSWFELAGQDHIVVFTDLGVFFYANNMVTAYSVDGDCYTGYDRCFFFEGDGTSAFYIYGNYRVWRYNADFTLEEVTDKLTVPTLLISAEADGTGTFNQGYNLLGNLASIEYYNADLFTYWGTDGLNFTVASTWTGAPTTYTCSTAGSWTPATGINAPNAKVGDQIFAFKGKGVLLPNNVDPSGQLSKIKVWISQTTQFDTKLEVVTTGTPTLNSQCRLYADPVERENQQAFIVFNSSQTFADLGGEDVVKVEFPTTKIVVTSIDLSLDPSQPMEEQATLNGEAVGV